VVTIQERVALEDKGAFMHQTWRISQCAKIQSDVSHCDILIRTLRRECSKI